MSRFLFLAVALALGSAACSDDTTTTPTPTTPVTVTDTFSGSLTHNGEAIYPFITSASGNVTATLATLAPDATLLVSLSLGTWNGNSCQIIIAKANATQSSSILGTASSSGSLCVRISDVGNIVDPITFEIQVLHP